MRTFETISAAGDAVLFHCIRNEAALPANVAAAVQPHLSQRGSPVDLCERFIESVYATIHVPDPENEAQDHADRVALVDQEALEIAAGAADLFASAGYHQALNGRAAAMVLAMRRDSGEAAPTGGWPDVDTDPAPVEALAKVPEPPEPVAVPNPAPVPPPAP